MHLFSSQEQNKTYALAYRFGLQYKTKNHSRIEIEEISMRNF